MMCTLSLIFLNSAYRNQTICIVCQGQRIKQREQTNSNQINQQKLFGKGVRYSKDKGLFQCEKREQIQTFLLPLLIQLFAQANQQIPYFYSQRKQILSNMKRTSKISLVTERKDEGKAMALASDSHLIDQNEKCDPNLQKTSAMRVNSFTPSQATMVSHPRQHMKTDIQRTPENAKEERLKTSPNIRQAAYRSPLQARNTNLPTHQRKNNTMLTQFHTIGEEVPLKNPQFQSSIISLVLPSPKRNSLLYSHSQKQSYIERNRSRSEDGHSLSKSKKKIKFTVFEDRQKSRTKKCSEVVCPVVSVPVVQYSIPYRCNPRITIDLFDQNTDNLTKIPSRTNINVQSNERKPVSLQKKSDISKSLLKTFSEKQLQKKVENILLKLSKYTFVAQFMQRRQILQKIQGYIMKKQPECKWHLLIVDQVFKKIRQQGKFQSIVSK